MKYIVMIFLLISMIFDIRNQKIPAVWIWSGILVMVLYRVSVFICGKGMWIDFILAFIPGIILYLFSGISKQIGNGDGLLIIVTGCFFPWKEHLGMLYLAFSLAAVFSIGLILVRRDMKNKRIAFAPFLFAASGITICM